MALVNYRPISKLFIEKYPKNQNQNKWCMYNKYTGKQKFE